MDETRVDMDAVRKATETFWGGQWGCAEANMADPRAQQYAVEHMAKAIRAYLAATGKQSLPA